MERHKCKLCSRTFVNGKALGGHMKAHLATLPLPPKPQPQPQLSESASASSSSDDDDDEDDEQEVGIHGEEEGPMIYGLRENPRKSFRFADPEFSFAVDAGSVVQDRESETESRNPTRRRSKRNWKSGETQRRPKLSKPSWAAGDSPSPAEPEPVSSVSDVSQEENVAMCLMMLSRDRWLRNKVEDEDREQDEEEKSIETVKDSKSKKIRGKYQCDKCKKMFRSHQALGSHRVIHKKASDSASASKIYECPFCSKIFGSGQALGGHKRSHMLGSSANAAAASSKLFVRETSIDLNLPAPFEEDSYSVVSDAEFIR